MKPNPTGNKTADIDPALILELQQLQSTQGITQRELAAMLCISETYITRAFNGTFHGHVAKFESKARSVIAQAQKSQRAPAEELSTKGFMVEPMNAFLSTVQQTGDIGVAWSDAGKGKSKGIEIYRRNDPFCIVVTARKSIAGWRAIRLEILKALQPINLRKNESYDDFLGRTFKGSHRLLIVDNAHLITESARAWLAYDWYEETGCPVALVGNPAIMEQWNANDQHQSRVGLALELQPKLKARDTAQHALHLMLPEAEHNEEVLGMAESVMKSKGAARSLKKHISHAKKLMEGGSFGTVADAFRAANALLLSNAKITPAA
jgi:DNA transposition AAA+ family ATPase